MGVACGTQALGYTGVISRPIREVMTDIFHPLPAVLLAGAASPHRHR